MERYQEDRSTSITKRNNIFLNEKGLQHLTKANYTTDPRQHTNTLSFEGHLQKTVKHLADQKNKTQAVCTENIKL